MQYGHQKNAEFDANLESIVKVEKMYMQKVREPRTFVRWTKNKTKKPQNNNFFMLTTF